MEPLAHSAAAAGRAPQLYAEHIRNVRRDARRHADDMLAFAASPPPGLAAAIEIGAEYHDVGKLDAESQAVLASGRGARMRWDHVDAGVAHLMAAGNEMAAWLVRAHHAPGLSCWAKHFADQLGRRLRGRRSDEDIPQRHDDQVRRTDGQLGNYIAAHRRALDATEPSSMKAQHGLTMRLALSCLVDADHTDTARFETGRSPSAVPAPRWSERLARLDSYVGGLPVRGDEARNRNRVRFYDICRSATFTEPMIACEGPVGIGKTTAVTAHLLRSAQELNLRRLFVVAPYTNIITQTVNRLRDALVLPGEEASEIVAEHHHRADFSRFGDRDLAVLWRAPVVVTTAVQLFETLASNHPGQLRKLHELPGSAIFIDEAHAALPTHLWQQNWLWLKDLAEKWRCKLVFASGSLARFWENGKIVGEPRRLKEMSEPIAPMLAQAERRRIQHRTLNNVGGLAKLVTRALSDPGPRLLIVNTVQSAAVVARAMRAQGADVLHLSTALCPKDRDLILKSVDRRLDLKEPDWTLVATSCVEAGVDLSFRTAFRERFSAASLIQTGGRVNRNGEFDAEGGGVVYDFYVDRGEGITLNPAAQIPGEVLKRQFRDGVFKGDAMSPADVVTSAMEEELEGRTNHNALTDAEKKRDYPTCAKEGRVIDSDTRFVVIDQSLRERLERRELVKARDLLAGSVQIWSAKIDKLGLARITGREDVYAWPYRYDPEFLGYMAGLLEQQEILDAFQKAGGGIL